MSQFVSSAEKHIILLCYVYRARSLEHHDERGVAFFPTPTQVGCLFIGAMFFIWCLVDNIGLFQVTERSGLMAMDGRASRRPRERAGGGVDGARDTRVGVDIDVVSRQFRRRRLELTPPNHPVGRWWKAKKEKEKKKRGAAAIVMKHSKVRTCRDAVRMKNNIVNSAGSSKRENSAVRNSEWWGRPTGSPFSLCSPALFSLYKLVLIATIFLFSAFDCCARSTVFLSVFSMNFCFF